jgi:hypothetical protein
MIGMWSLGKRVFHNRSEFRAERAIKSPTDSLVTGLTDEETPPKVPKQPLGRVSRPIPGWGDPHQVTSRARRNLT